MGRRKTTEEFKSELFNANPNVEMLGEYIHSHVKIEVKCKKCGHEWSSYPNNLLRYECPACKGVAKKDTESFKKEMEKKNIEVLGEYINNAIKIKVKCKTCGYEWDSEPSELSRKRRTCACPVCSKKKASEKLFKPYEEFLKEFHERNPKAKDIEILSEYKNAKTEIQCRCKIDGHTWWVKPSDLLQGRGCRACFFRNNSGEGSYMYNPNLTDEDREERRKNKAYKDFVKRMLEKNNYTCQITGKKGGVLAVHHLNGYHWCKEGRLDENNVIVICEELHREFHNTYGYKWNTKEQWEEFM